MTELFLTGGISEHEKLPAAEISLYREFNSFILFAVFARSFFSFAV